MSLPAVKKAVLEVQYLDPQQLGSPRVRVVEGMLWCWVPGEFARKTESFPALLNLLAALVDAINAAAR